MLRTLALVLALTPPPIPVSTAAPVPKAKPLVQKVDGFSKIRKDVELDEIANVTLTDVEIYYPDEKKWRACTYDGKTWNAPDGAEQKKIRLSGTYKEAVGGGLKKGDILLNSNCHTEKPKEKGVAAYKTDKGFKDGTFWVEFWADQPGGLVPRPPASSGDGPTVGIELHLFQSCIMGDRRNSSMTVDLRTTVTYPAKK